MGIQQTLARLLSLEAKRAVQFMEQLKAELQRWRCACVHPDPITCMAIRTGQEEDQVREFGGDGCQCGCHVGEEEEEEENGEERE